MTKINPTPVAVFASGKGSNFEALIQHPSHRELYEVVLFVTDRPGCLAEEKAQAANIDVFSFVPKEYGSKQQFEAKIVQACRERNVHWIVLAGYMRLIGETLLSAYEARIINIHPSLLPSFPGKDAVEQAIAAQVTRTGVTVHYVDSGMDTGPIIRQVAVDIEPGDTSDTLRKRIQAQEHLLLPEVVCGLVTQQ